MEYPTNLMNDLLIQHINSLNEDKNRIIQDMIEKKVGLIDFDVEEGMKSRFKKIVIEHSGNRENVYYDDGSPDGLWLVSFINHSPTRSNKPNRNGGSMHLTIGFTYHIVLKQ